jgi:hypothetical protein
MTYHQRSVNQRFYLKFHIQLMMLYTFLIVWKLVYGYSTDACDSNAAESNSCKSIPHIVESHQIHQEQTDEPSSELSDDHMRKKRKELKVEIGQDVFTITDSLGGGGDGVAYMAKDVHGHGVVFKVLDLKEAELKYFEIEVLALERLGRLIAKDDVNFIIVQKYIKGGSFADLLSNYSLEKAGDRDYPSYHQANHLKEQYFHILWNFRNATQMAHNDFRPYNIVGEEAIDFGRSEELSTDPIKRQKQINFDDDNAEKEWQWFYIDQDFAAIERNPLLPNSLEVAFDIWDKYMVRYSTYDYYKKYRVAWMRELYHAVDKEDAESAVFPLKSEFIVQ